jgi:hypothetical protein
MKKHFTKDFLRTLVGLSLALVIGLGVNYVAADWQGPSGAPTSGNPNNLLTTGFDQIKTGNLSVRSTTPPPVVGSGPGALQLFGLQVGDWGNAYNANAQKGIWSNGPLAVAGNSGLYGSTDIGPTLNTNAPVTLKVTGIAKVSDSAIIGSTGTPDYNLHLVGDTNIGRGNTCVLTPDQSDEGCPIGAYVSNVEYIPACQSPWWTNSGTEIYPCVLVTCRYVNPVTNPTSLGVCSGGSSNTGSTTAMDVTLAHSWSGGTPSWTTSLNQPNTSTQNIPGTSTPISCTNSPNYASTGSTTNGYNRTVTLDANQSGYGISGGVPPYTYAFYRKELPGITNNIDFSLSAPSFDINNPTSYGWAVFTGGLVGSTASITSSRLASVETFHPTNPSNSQPVMTTKLWAVVVTDSTGVKAVDFFGAHDMYECW